jgi:predicted restriction endonuclease
VKQRIREMRHPSIVELTEGEAAYLDRFYRQVPENTIEGAAQDNIRSSISEDIISDLEAIGSDLSIDETTRTQLIPARLGQGQFRDAVLRRWEMTCAVTGCTQLEVLRASHVTPWRDADNKQRLNPANGILLTANLDALFDRFLISFDDDGRMLLSDRLGRSCRELFGLPARLRGELTAEERSFLAHHRGMFQR